MKHTEYIVPIGEEAKEFDEMFIGVIRRQPELVRCKDCKYNRTAKCPMHDEGYSSGYGYYAVNCNEPNDFCSKAERKEE